MWQHIKDQQTGRNIAFIVDGDVLKDAPGNPKIGTVQDGVIRDPKGNIVAYLGGEHATGPELAVDA